MAQPNQSQSNQPTIADLFCRWDPRPGFLVLLPSRSAPKTNSGLFIPESETKKNNSGICIKAFTIIDKDIFVGKECFFANHSEYRVEDTDTGYLLYIISADLILMTRTPPEDVARFSREKGNGLTFETITHEKD
jgi:co-chaperonin GroES (HSP10)